MTFSRCILSPVAKISSSLLLLTQDPHARPPFGKIADHLGLMSKKAQEDGHVDRDIGKSLMAL
jgi:hypothetical protein